MKATAKYDELSSPPLLSFNIHGAPHKRSDDVTMKVYRCCINMACRRAGIFMPIDHPIYLSVEFVNPTSPDLDNLLTALYRALDGKNTMLGRHTVLTDDRLIYRIVNLGKLFTADLEDDKRLPTQRTSFIPMQHVA